MAYAVLRIFLAGRYLGSYGLHAKTFAALELSSSAVLAVASARAVGALLDRRKRSAIEWTLITVAAYLVPDVYVLISTRRVPRSIFIVVIAWIVIGTVAGFIKLRGQLSAAAKGSPAKPALLLGRVPLSRTAGNGKPPPVP